jgi:hypothetical protein
MTKTASRPAMGAVDNRGADRFPVNAGTGCSFFARVAEEVGGIRVRTVSMDGIGLSVAHRVEPGALLAVGLSNPEKGFAKTILVRVVHATPEMGGFLVGGEFVTPLTYQELTALVL